MSWGDRDPKGLGAEMDSEKQSHGERDRDLERERERIWGGGRRQDSERSVDKMAEEELEEE